MTITARMAPVLTLVVASAAVAAPAKPQVERFTVRVKMQDAAGRTTLVPVGEVTRTGGKVAVRGMAAPALDKLTDDFIAAWQAHRHPASVSITETIASDTGMRPTWNAHTFTFTPDDELYPAAVIRQFVEARGYEALGMRSVRFVEFDHTAESPPGAHDRASRTINIRKGAKLDFSGGYDSFFIQAPVRRPGMGTPSGVLRVSASDPRIAVSQNHDDGTATIAWFKVFPGGRIDVLPLYAGKQLESHFGTYGAPVEVSLIIDANDYTKRVVPKTSKRLLEAHIVEELEHHHMYDITPTIDPASLR